MIFFTCAVSCLQQRNKFSKVTCNCSTGLFEQLLQTREPNNSTQDWAPISPMLGANYFGHLLVLLIIFSTQLQPDLDTQRNPSLRLPLKLRPDGALQICLLLLLVARLQHIPWRSYAVSTQIYHLQSPTGTEHRFMAAPLSITVLYLLCHFRKICCHASDQSWWKSFVANKSRRI